MPPFFCETSILPSKATVRKNPSIIEYKNKIIGNDALIQNTDQLAQVLGKLNNDNQQTLLYMCKNKIDALIQNTNQLAQVLKVLNTDSRAFFLKIKRITFGQNGVIKNGIQLTQVLKVLNNRSFAL